MDAFITQELAHKFLRGVYLETEDPEDTTYEEFIEFVLESSDLFMPEVVYAAYVTQRTVKFDLITESNIS